MKNKDLKIQMDELSDIMEEAQLRCIAIRKMVKYKDSDSYHIETCKSILTRHLCSIERENDPVYIRAYIDELSQG